MIRTILGAETFREGMDLYFERHDGEAATVEDFLKVFEDVSGPRPVAVLALVPSGRHAEPDGHAVAQCRRRRNSSLEIEQSVPPTPSESRKRLMHIPLAFGLVGNDGKDIDYGHVDGAAVENGVIHVRKRRHASASATSPSGRRCRSTAASRRRSRCRIEQTPGRARLPRPPRQRSVLALAGVQLAADRRADDPPSRQIRGGKAAGILGTSSPSLPARSPPTRRWSRPSARWRWRLPGEADIARELGTNIDPDAIFAAREALADGDRRRQRATVRRRSSASSAATTHSAPTRRAPAAGRCATRCSTISAPAAGRPGACGQAFPVAPTT